MSGYELQCCVCGHLFTAEIKKPVCPQCRANVDNVEEEEDPCTPHIGIKRWSEQQ